MARISKDTKGIKIRVGEKHDSSDNSSDEASSKRFSFRRVDRKKFPKPTGLIIFAAVAVVLIWMLTKFFFTLASHS